MRTVRFVTTLLAAGLLAAGCSPPGGTNGDASPPDAGPEDPRFAPYVAALRDELRRTGTPGASIAFLADGRLAYAVGVGMKGPRSSEYVTTQTLFRIASIVKPMTAAAVLSLADEGRVDLEAPVAQYLPYLRATPPTELGRVRVRQLLDHTAGLGDRTESSCPAGPGAAQARFRDEPVEQWSPPGRLHNYANPGYAAAGMILETVSGMPYADAMQARLFGPLGMTSTTFDPAVARAADHSLGKNSDGGTDDPTSYDCGYMRPAGYAFSTASDFARFAEVLLGSGALLRSETLARMTAAEVPDPFTPGASAGLGIYAATIGGTRLLFHSGGIGGFSTGFVLAPERRFGIVLLTNQASFGTQISPTSFAIQMALRYLGVDPGVQPDGRTDPATWGVYAGTYNDPLRLGRVTVSLRGSELWADGAALGGANRLEQVAGDSFATMAGNRRVPLYFARQGGGPADLLATRMGVAARVP